ncbi:MAG: N-acetylmuramoyl-L-alanine amidase [Bacteroidaceae bacterium]|nr:N-acetylmuramoyl-L-alanine amidase [Bacteroidaceae bacterium]
MNILIDNGHGSNTAGKRSPDGRLLEYAWTRAVAMRIVDGLRALGYDARRVVTEELDISLAERCKRVNSICERVGANNALLISVHVNAAGMGGWRNERGWTVWVCNGACAKSIGLAQTLYAEADKMGLKGNRSVPKCKYWEGNYYILRNTACPAVLTENLFQDNKQDVDYLLSDKGQENIAQLHINGIVNYLGGK